MFQFPGFASIFRWMPGSRPAGCPIRKSAAVRVFAPHRGLSQLVTSFFASESLGILHAPFSPFLVTFLHRRSTQGLASLSPGFIQVKSEFVLCVICYLDLLVSVGTPFSRLTPFQVCARRPPDLCFHHVNVLLFGGE